MPPNSEPEVVRERSDIWTFGVFVAALFHDIGKAATDHDVELFDETGAAVGNWTALRGPMNAPYYRAKFRTNRAYTDHQKLGAIVMRPLLPQAALDWLFSDTDLTIQLIEYLSGDGSGVLAKIIRDADMSSVRDDVSSNRIPAAETPTSLPAKLLSAFREMLDSGRLPVNKPGAAGWVTSTDVWLVSKRAIDAARDHLKTATNFNAPKDNQACMSELQAAQICKATDDDKAIWRMMIVDGDWSMKLSFLRIPVEQVWPDAGRRPSAFSGEIGEASAKKPVSPQRQKKASQTETAVAAGDDDNQQMSSDEPTNAKLVSEQRNQAPEPKPDLVDEPEGFFQWMRDGISSGFIQINTRNAPVHVVDQGLLLVSPRIFKMYTNNEGEKYKRVQRSIINRRLVLKSNTGGNFKEYAVIGDRNSSTIKGMVISDPERVFGMSFPSSNSVLTG